MDAKAAPRKADIPYSPAAERQLIASILNDELVALDQDVRYLTRDDFFLPESRAVWDAFTWLWAHDMQVTHTTVCHALAELHYIDALDKVVMPSGLTTEGFLLLMMSENYTSYGCGAWAKIIREYAGRRALIKQGTRMVQDGYGTAPEKWVSEYEGQF